MLAELKKYLLRYFDDAYTCPVLVAIAKRHATDCRLSEGDTDELIKWVKSLYIVVPKTGLPNVNPDSKASWEKK